MQNLALIFKALGDENRMKIVLALIEFESLCACQLVQMLKLSGATVSRHMDILIDSHLVLSHKEGRWVHYKLQMPSLLYAFLEEKKKGIDLSFFKDIKNC